MDEFLSHLIWNGRIAESIDSIKLFTKIHPGNKCQLDLMSLDYVSDCKTVSVDFENAQPEDIIRNYVKNESLKAGKVNAALEKYLNSEMTTENILSGHGVK